MVVNLHKNEQRKTLNMAKTISKLANSLTKNVFSNKIISDTKINETFAEQINSMLCKSKAGDLVWIHKK